MQDAVGLAHLLLQQFQLLPRAAIGGRQYQIQIIGAGVNHTERLAEMVNEAAHLRAGAGLERIGERVMDIGGECKHVRPGPRGQDRL